RRHRGADQRQRHGVARGILRELLRHLLGAVVMRLDIGAAPGQQQPVEAGEDLVGRQVVTQRRDQERQRADALGRDGDVILGNLVDGVIAFGAHAAGDRHGGPGIGAGAGLEGHGWRAGVGGGQSRARGGWDRPHDAARSASMQEIATPLLAYKSMAVLLWLAALFTAERLFPAARYPHAAPPKAWRLVGSGVLWGLNAGLSVVLVVPVTAWAASVAPQWRPLWWSGWSGLALDLLILDGLIYGWHRVNHRAPFLWRFHGVHHLDRTLDSTSALRFHFGEVALSALARAGVVLALAVPLASVLAFETLLLIATIFHHSNLRLPENFERGLSRVIVTPSIHWV